jgi:hypothetical protein
MRAPQRAAPRVVMAALHKAAEPISAESMHHVIILHSEPASKGAAVPERERVNPDLVDA